MKERRQRRGETESAAFVLLGGFAVGTLFVCIHVTLDRLGLSGGGILGHGFDLTGDVGVNSVRNADHVTGVRMSQFAARVQLAWTPDRR